MGAAAPRAVVFDLWNTIAEWPAEAWAEVRPSVAERVGLPLEEFDARWYGDLAHVREMGQRRQRKRTGTFRVALIRPFA